MQQTRKATGAPKTPTEENSSRTKSQSKKGNYCARIRVLAESGSSCSMARRSGSKRNRLSASPIMYTVGGDLDPMNTCRLTFLNQLRTSTHSEVRPGSESYSLL